MNTLHAQKYEDKGLAKRHLPQPELSGQSNPTASWLTWAMRKEREEVG
ncbi:hypothetical protein [Porphyromonas catoniae]|nr:hypothetical protein [Porphyromonas catoniae]